ncbi:MAG: hypothetical protein J6K48_09785 [Lachnospiraceae bacterium]|nr:hypothetical protein [Lachnospiraceae bacterium]
MQNGLDWLLMFSLVMIVVCVLIVIFKFVRYFDNAKKVANDKKNSMQDIKILEVKLADIKLKNKGHSLDENIKFIYNDESISFSMGWEDILE